MLNHKPERNETMGFACCTYVCTDCRTSARRSMYYDHIKPKCQHCGEPMISIGRKKRLPKKKCVKKWEEFIRPFLQMASSLKNKISPDVPHIGRKGMVKKKYQRSSFKENTRKEFDL